MSARKETVGYYNNLALHISDATLKGMRRLAPEPEPCVVCKWWVGLCTIGLTVGAVLWAVR